MFITPIFEGVFQPVRYKKNEHVEEDLFVDGGTLCNYPLHAFDGKYQLWVISRKSGLFPHISLLSCVKNLFYSLAYVTSLGWWLSMKPEDSFLNKIKSLDNINQLMEQKERFGGFNEKTVGFLVVSTSLFSVCNTPYTWNHQTQRWHNVTSF